MWPKEPNILNNKIPISPFPTCSHVPCADRETCNSPLPAAICQNLSLQFQLYDFLLLSIFCTFLGVRGMPVKEIIGNPSLPFSKFEGMCLSHSTTQIATQNGVELWPSHWKVRERSEFLQVHQPSLLVLLVEQLFIRSI